MGQCYVEKYRNEKIEQDFHLGIEFLDKAKAVGRELGLSIDLASNLKVRLQQMKETDVEISGRFWLQN